MNTIKEFMAEDATVIVGTVIDDSMDDRLRVTMVATGLGGAASSKQRTPNIQLVEAPVVRTGTDNAVMPSETINYEDLDQPAVVRRGRASAATMPPPAFDAAEIPAFLRKQAD
jgi:cell division protein FtsZ